MNPVDARHAIGARCVVWPEAYAARSCPTAAARRNALSQRHVTCGLVAGATDRRKAGPPTYRNGRILSTGDRALPRRGLCAATPTSIGMALPCKQTDKASARQASAQPGRNVGEALLQTRGAIEGRRGVARAQRASIDASLGAATEARRHPVPQGTQQHG